MPTSKRICFGRGLSAICVSRQHISGEKGQIPAVQSSKNEPSKREATPSVAKKAAVLSSSMPMPSMQKEDHSKGSESAHQKEENKKKQTSSQKFNPNSLLRITNHFPLSICFLSLLYSFFLSFYPFYPSPFIFYHSCRQN